jgi:hypothetical protein
MGFWICFLCVVYAEGLQEVVEQEAEWREVLAVKIDCEL